MDGTLDQGGHQEPKGSHFLVSLALGHMSIHWFQQLWPLIIPSMKATFGLSNIQLGTLSSVKQFTTGPLVLPSGILADFFRRKTGLILAGAFLFMGVSHMLLGLTTNYFWLLLTAGFLGIGTVLWHPAAMSSLSLRFPQRRASALAVHGMGASVGDTLAPIAIGALLLVLDWQDLLKIQVIPGLLIAFVFWQGLRSLFQFQTASRPSLSNYWKDIKTLLKHRVVLAIMGVEIATGIARHSTLTFLPVYLQEDLGYSTFVLGFHITLLYAMGAVSQPVMGHLSDRFGRKAVLLPGLVIFGLLYLTLAVADPGIQLALVIGALGLFFYALTTITLATLLDVGSVRVQASTLGVTSFITQIFTLPAPIIAGFIVTGIDIKAVFVFAGIVTLVGALVLAAAPVPKTSGPPPPIAG